MMLLTYREFVVHPQENHRVVVDKMTAFATRVSLPEAIRKLDSYSEQFNRHYGGHTAVEFTLVQVAAIPYLSDEDLGMARVELVEALSLNFQKDKGTAIN